MAGTAYQYSARCTPRKLRLLRGLIIGKKAEVAVALLSLERRAGSVATIKLIKSALAQLPEVQRSRAFVSEMEVNEGPKRSMYMPRAQGRASPVIKRTSNVRVNLGVK